MKSLFVAVLVLTTSSALFAQASAGKAEMFYKHGLVEDAKRTAIQAIFAHVIDDEVVRCKALLAKIAMDEKRLDTAVEIWQELADKHAKSAEGRVAVLMLKQWSTLARSVGDLKTGSAVAKTYASVAEFWTGGLGSFEIDTTWLPAESAAEYWLKKIVTEFPGTPEAEAALVGIARTWIGRESDASGRGGLGAWGEVRKLLEQKDADRTEFDRKMAMAAAAIKELDKACPASPHLARLQFMVAHVYWLVDDKEKATPWFVLVKNSAGNTPTLWSHLASLRLQYWKS
ncbi:MAG: hypothetical protein H6832_01225 [Planctomycetes bacterium]|nr:hypothetical protein [Planctomycetota bacterium]MCB9917006.1 hypothetical protein [Planctomycetota bacterium]